MACDTANGGCHAVSTSLTVVPAYSVKTVSPGSAFALGVSWTGGTGAQISLPAFQSNAKFLPSTPWTYDPGTATGSTNVNLVAPATIGTYTLRVYISKSGPATNYSDVQVTVAASYTLTYTAGPNGSITGTSPQTIDSGASGTAVIPVAATGYHFVNWSDGSIANPRTDTSVTASIAVTANFAINTYTITPTAGANGSISPSTAVTVNYGANQAFTITPATGYHVASVLVDGASVGAVASYTFNSVAAAHSISATFAINTYTITPTAGANGSISPSTAVTVNYGANRAFTITPATGYHVASVLIDGASVGAVASYTFNSVAAAHSISATFAADAVTSYTLTYTAGPNGAITGASPQTVASGASGTAVTPVPATGYHFVNWSDGSIANPRTDTSVTASISVMANFAINTYTITPTAGANGSISPSTAVTVNHGASQAFTITPAIGYHVASVLVDRASVGGVTSYTFNSVAAAHTISVTFAADTATTYTLTYTAGPNGAVTGTSPQTVSSGASGTPVTATPAAGYHFVNWNDSSTANPRTDTNVTASISVTANFAIDTHTITTIAGPNGSISPSGTVTVNHAADQSFTITAAGGYHISGMVVDGAPLATAQATQIAVINYTFTNVTASHTISANFAPNVITGLDTTGPLTTGLKFRSGPEGSGSVTLNAVVDDSATGGSKIIAAEYFLDHVGGNGTGTPMRTSDGSFGSVMEAVRATVRVSGLSSRGHTIYVRGQDAAGNWGPAARVYFQVRTSRRIPLGEVRIMTPDDGEGVTSPSAIVILMGTGRQQVIDD
jgi:hypothetical protein